MKHCHHLFYALTLLTLGCAHTPLPRGIQNASEDRLASESKDRFSEERLLAVKKNLSDAKIEGAAVDCRLGEFDQGIKTLRSLYKKMEMKSVYWLTLGNCSIQRLDYDRAYYFYKLALSKSKDKIEEARVYNNLGVLLWKKSNYQDAVSHFLEAKNRAPLLAPIFNLCSLYLGQQQLSLANEIISQAPKTLESDPEWKNLVSMAEINPIAPAKNGKGQ